MSTQVSIEILTKITHTDGDRENISYNTKGVLYQKQDEYFLRYKDHPDLGKTWSIIKWSFHKPYKINIIRQGEVRVQQEFLKEHTDRTQYHSPAGILEMEATTIDISLEEGQLITEYSLKINEQMVGKYTIQINYKEIRDEYV